MRFGFKLLMIPISIVALGVGVGSLSLWQGRWIQLTAELMVYGIIAVIALGVVHRVRKGKWN